MKKKICFITSSRADYGLLYPLLVEVDKDKAFDLKLVATGTHLLPEFGLTYKEIEKGGFKIDEKVKMAGSGSVFSATQSLGESIRSFAVIFRRIGPDVTVLLGDRFEILSPAIASFLAKIPIAHIHGGELTAGAMDDAIRHSITKFSQLHFTSTEEYRRRVIQLGESPGRVFNVGALAIDNIKSKRLMGKAELERDLRIDLSQKIVLVTYHPVTLENNTAGKQTEELLSALGNFKELKVIFTGTNADIGGQVITALIRKYLKNNPGKGKIFPSLGSLKYLSLLKYVSAVAGNSSSGIIEAPSFKIPTVNIGDRQKGRARVKSILDCQPRKEAISKAIHKALSPEFRSFCKTVRNIYGEGKAAVKICSVLKKHDRELWDIKKTFYDVRMPNGL